jgi:hypothetical protein
MAQKKSISATAVTSHNNEATQRSGVFCMVRRGGCVIANIKALWINLEGSL